MPLGKSCFCQCHVDHSDRCLRSKVEQENTYNDCLDLKGVVVHAIDLSTARHQEIYPGLRESFNPSRWLDPAFPTWQELLSVYPRLLGHHGLGPRRR